MLAWWQCGFSSRHAIRIISADVPGLLQHPPVRDPLRHHRQALANLPYADRKSLEERYKDHDGYVKAVAKAAKNLAKDRLLLADDVQRYIDAAQASNVLL